MLQKCNFIYLNGELFKNNITKQMLYIAEIGINHNGDIEIAKKLIDMAKENNCDAVKFQKEQSTLYTIKNPKFRRKALGDQHKGKRGLEFSEKYDEIDVYYKKKI